MKLIISGYYGFGNMGDEAILAVLVKELQERFRRAEIVVLSATPQETAKQYRVRAINRWNLGHILWELRSARAFISGGGGLIQDRTSRRSAFYYLGLIALAHRNCPVFLVGQGIGPLNNQLVCQWAQRLLRQVDFAMVRDESSEQLLQAWGLPAERTVVGGDLALLFWPHCRSLRKAPDRASAYWAVCLKGGLPKQLKEKLVRQLDDLSEEGKVVFLVVHPNEDLREAVHIAAQMRHPPSVRQLSNPQELLAALSGAKALVGMRLHSLIFALLTIRPFLALSDDPKIAAFVQQVEASGGPRLPLLTPAQATNINLVEALLQLTVDPQLRVGLLSAGEALYHQTYRALDKIWYELSYPLKGITRMWWRLDGLI